MAKNSKNIPAHPKAVQDAFKTISEHIASQLLDKGKPTKGGIHIRVGYKSARTIRAVRPVINMVCVPDPNRPGQYICH